MAVGRAMAAAMAVVARRLRRWCLPASLLPRHQPRHPTCQQMTQPTYRLSRRLAASSVTRLQKRI